MAHMIPAYRAVRLSGYTRGVRLLRLMTGFPITSIASVVSAWIWYRGGEFKFAVLVTPSPIAHLASSYSVSGIRHAR